MSGEMNIQRKKFSQHELRQLMNKQKSKVQQERNTKKIESPLAKYNDLGQLTCILCKSIVRSADVWTVHINAKQHRQNIKEAKKLKASLATATDVRHKRGASPSNGISAKKTKGILKDSGPQSSQTIIHPVPSVPNKPVPDDFFDKNTIETSNYFEATLKKTNIRSDLVNFKRVGDRRNITADVTEKNATETIDVDDKDEAIPEGFFDDPKKDAKARHLEYKDPVEEEWERFQKEIKEAAQFSNAIIAEDQEDATTERQIDEIDEQIRNWSRVLNLEKKKEISNSKEDTTENSQTFSGNESSDSESADFDEYLDWRAKKSHR